jgi:hypothetical protein
MSEERPPIGNSPPEDDLRSVIAASLAEDKKTSAPAASADADAAATSDAGSRGPGDQPPTPQPGAGTPPEGSSETGDAGKPVAEPAKSGEGEAPKPGEAAKPPSDGAATTEAPTHWSAEDKAQFEALPRTARGPFLNLYKRMEAGFTPKLQRGAQLERDYGPLDTSIFNAPTRQWLSERGQTPAQKIDEWASVERGLVGQNPEVKNQIAARIIHNYGADPSRVAAILHELRGFAPASGGDRPAVAPNGATAPGVDPVLHQRLSALETESQQEKQRREAAEYLRAGDQISAFANETDSAGQLKHPFFAELEAEMTSLAQFERIQGRAPVLQDLYDRALWANPSTRQKQQVLERDAETKRAQEERRAKSEQARRAGSSVTGAPGPGQTSSTPTELSLRDQIKANMNGGSPTSGGPGRI